MASMQAQQMLAKERQKVIPAEDWKEIMANYERKPLEEMHALNEEEDIIDEDLDDKDHPIAGAVGLREQLTGGNDLVDDQETNILDDCSDEFDKELDEILDEELDDINVIGEPSKLDTVSGITTEDLEAELEMDLDNLKLDDIDTTDVNLDDEELLED